VLIRVTWLCGPWGVKIKEGIAATGMQQDSHVSKTCLHVIETPAKRAGRRRYQDLQTMRTSITTPRYNAPPHC
jgi:hypothetical protein